MKWLSSILLVIVSVSATADVLPHPRPKPRPPVVEPGPVQALDANSVAAIDAVLAAKSTDLKKFIEAGNEVTSGTFQALAPGQTLYTVTRQQCTSGGFVGRKCLGGAQLQIMIETKQAGSMVGRTVKSSVVKLK